MSDHGDTVAIQARKTLYVITSGFYIKYSRFLIINTSRLSEVIFLICETVQVCDHIIQVLFYAVMYFTQKYNCMIC